MLLSFLLAFSCNPKQPSIQNATSGSTMGGVPGGFTVGKGGTPGASSMDDYLEKFMIDASTCDRPFGDNTALEYVSPQAVNRISGDIKINGYCYDAWNISSSREVYSPAAGTEYTVAISNEDSYCHRLTILVVEEGKGYAIYPGEYSPDTDYLDPWQEVQAWVDGSPDCPNAGSGWGVGGLGTGGGGGGGLGGIFETTGSASPGVEGFMESFISLNNCNGPEPMTSYISESGLRSRSIPTTGQKVNNFCYDDWNIVSYDETGSSTRVVATIGGESYCHELTYEIVEEAGGYRMKPGTWHDDVSYVDPWVSERRDISDSTCPNGGLSGSIGGVLGGVGTGSGGVYASSSRDFMESFLDLNNCDGPSLDYMSESHMNERSIPMYGIEINNFCYETWAITSESPTYGGTRYVATVGNDSYCHQLTYEVVDNGGTYAMTPGLHHSDTGYVDPWVSEIRSVTDPTCQNQGGSTGSGGGGGTGGLLGAYGGATSGPDAFIEQFVEMNNCEAPSPTTNYVSRRGLDDRLIPQTEQINNFCYDGWNIHTKTEAGDTTTYVATIGNPGGFCHELTYEVVTEDGGYRLKPGLHHASVNYVDPWVSEDREAAGSPYCPTYAGAQNTYAVAALLGTIDPGGLDSIFGSGSGGLGTMGTTTTSFASDDAFMESFVSLNNCNGPAPTDAYVSRKGMTARGIPHTEVVNNFCYDAWNIHKKETRPDKSVYTVSIGGGDDSYCHELVYEVVIEDGGYRTIPGTHHADVNYVDPWVSERRNLSDRNCPNGYGAKNTYSGGGGLVVPGGSGAVAPSDPDAFMASWEEAGNGCGLIDPPTSYLSPTHLSKQGLSPSSVTVNNFCYDDFKQIDSTKVADGQQYTVLIGMTGSWCHKLTYVVTADGLKPGAWHSDTGYVDPWVSSEQWVDDPQCP